MIEFFTRHPTAANLLMLLMMAAGLAQLPEIKRETFPLIDDYEVEVRVVFPGASPADLASSVCRPLEDAVDGISYTEEMRCQARSSLAILTLKMHENGDFQSFKDDINTAVDGLDSLPPETEQPVVQELGRTQPVIKLALTADLPRTELKDLAEAIKGRMQQDPDIPMVTIEGFSQREFQVRIPQHRLFEHGLSLQDIARRLSAQNVDVPVGTITSSQREYQVRFNDERHTVRALEDLIVLSGSAGGELRLGDIATVQQGFEDVEDRVTYNGRPAALLAVTKNSQDDSLNVLEAVEAFVAQERQRLPESVNLKLTQDQTSVIMDRLTMLMDNAWQGLLLVFGVMWLFFGTRYATWVVLGLPVSFIASAFVLGQIGVSINMLSMVALLLALGILMDDSIVISESIGSQMRHGASPLKATINGTRLVARGVIASFLTTICFFSGLLVLEGNLGQLLVVIPIVLLSVVTVSLIEAFWILPHHLYHSLEHGKNESPGRFRADFDRRFNGFRAGVDRWVGQLVDHRYAFMGAVIAGFLITLSLLPAGFLKFSAFPDVEGDVLQARVIMPAGTLLEDTEAVLAQIRDELDAVGEAMGEEQEQGQAIQAVTVIYGKNQDAFETGPHLATLSVDLLTAEQRQFSLGEFQAAWQERIDDIRGPLHIALTEPTLGPAGRALKIRLQGLGLTELAQAGDRLKAWLSGYSGVSNLMADLRPGMPEFSLALKPGAYRLGLDVRTIAEQLRAAYQGVKTLETTIGAESYEVRVALDQSTEPGLSHLMNFPIVHPGTGARIPLVEVADIRPSNGFSRIHRVNNQPTVTLVGDVDSRQNNVNGILADLSDKFLPALKADFPGLTLRYEGEVAEAAKTQDSLQVAMILALIGVFALLSFQFRSYLEPMVVLITLPLALIGVIWGHLLMGLDISMPSLLGFVALGGIVVNDSILLVDSIKRHLDSGEPLKRAAARASHDRCRAVLLTSLTTIAGLTPLLFETSLQAQVLIPLATSIVFGIASSTLLVLFMVPCLYHVFDDLGFTRNRQDWGSEAGLRADQAKFDLS